MNLLRRFVAWVREEGVAGQYLCDYEQSRYKWVDRLEIRGAISVPVDAEELADVSFYQAGMDWSKYPHRSSIIRIGQGAWKDTSFETFYNAARVLGIALGGYWFFDGRTTPKQQADIIIASMSGKSFELELWIDWERSYSGAYEGITNVIDLMQRVEAAGVKCKAVGLYTGYYWFTANSTASTAQKAYLAARPLWLAWYASASVVKVPPPWTDYTLWQWGTPVIAWGQPTAEIDANKSRLGRNDFAVSYLGGATPPDGGSMNYFELRSNVAGEYRSIRAPHTSSHIQGAKIGQLNVGAVAKSIEKYQYTASVVISGATYAQAGDIWWRVYEANGAPVDGWIAEVHLGKRYLNVTEVGAPPPPPAPADSTIDVVLTDKDAAGTVVAVYKGTLTKQ